MNKLLTLTLLFCLCIKVAFSQCKIDYSEYTLVLDEEFDTYNGSAATMFANGPWRGTYPNDPNFGKGIEIYNPNRVSLIPDGNGGHRLLLTASKSLTPPYQQRDNKDITYESGMITLIDDYPGDPVTQNCNNDPNARGFTYGMFEIRCKMPASNNTYRDAWPAFWAISRAAEIDIIDNLTRDHRDYYQTGILDWTIQPWWNFDNTTNTSGNPDWIWVPFTPSAPVYNLTHSYSVGDIIKPDANNGWQISFQAVNPINASKCAVFSYSTFHRDLVSQFHTYTAVWTPDKVTFFFDGREIQTIPSAMVDLADCPLNLIANLQIREDANLNSPDNSEYNWEIDYIKVYKPKGPNGNATNLTVGDYINTPFKNEHEFINYNTMVDKNKNYINASEYTKVKANPRSIAFSSQDPTQVFFAGEDGRLYSAVDPQGDQSWTTLSQIPMNHTPNFPAELIDGDLINDDVNGKLLYRGGDGRVQYYGYNGSNWVHGYVDQNWSNPNPFEVDNGKACMAVSQNGTIFYKGTDDKIHYFPTGQGNAHAWIGHTYLANGTYNHYVKNDVLLQEVGNYTDVIYKGNDDRIQTFWIDMTQNPPQYVHGYIDLSMMPSWKVKSDPGSMVMGDFGEVFYINTQGEIQGFFLTASGWSHIDLATTSSASQFNYNSVGGNGAYARNGITYDQVNRRVLYMGNDGRMQYFGINSNGDWYHGYRDDYWSTVDYRSFTAQNTDDFPSLIHDNTFDRTYYIGDFNYAGSYSYQNTSPTPNNALYPYDHQKHLRYFTYEPCEYISPCNTPYSTKILAKQGVTTGLNSTLFEKSQIAYPNPSNTGVFNIMGIESGSYIEVVDVQGKVVYVNAAANVNDKIDLSKQPNGVYILFMKTNSGVYRQKLMVNQ